MRIKRTYQKQKERKKSVGIFANFFIFIPVAAIITSIVVVNIYNGNLNFINNKSNNSKTAFNYLIGNKSFKLYRIEISRHDTYEEAAKTIDAVKEKKLNAFILKEKGFIVIFGVFTKEEAARAAKKTLANLSVENAIVEINTSKNIPNNNPIYISEDGEFVNTANKADVVILEVLNSKSELSIKILEDPELENVELLQEVLDKESQLESYRLVFENLDKDKSKNVLAQKYEMLLKELLEFRIEVDNAKSYYYVQNSLLNQLQLVEKFKREMGL